MKSRRVGSAEDIVVTGEKPLSVDSIKPAAMLAQTAHACLACGPPGLPPQGATRRRRANRPLSTLGKEAKRHDPAAFIGTLAGGAQGCLGHKGGKSHKSLA